VRLGELSRRATACAKTSVLEDLPPDGTLGGALAADPFGPDWTLDRRLRNEVLGVEIALANGELVVAGGRVVKNVTGFDLVRLYCGSLGTLGVLTRATVRLRALPERERLVRARFRRNPRLRAQRSPSPAAASGPTAGPELPITGDAQAVGAGGASQERPLPLNARGSRRSRHRCRLRARLRTPGDVTALCCGQGRRLRRARVSPLAARSCRVDKRRRAVRRRRALGSLFAERAPGAGPRRATYSANRFRSRCLLKRVSTRAVLAPGRFVGGI
jgi:FAD/FMN-containing dehydrogenase